MDCEEARNVLKGMGIDDKVVNPSSEWDAGKHYAECAPCQKIGMSKIVGREFNCEEALITATKENLLWPQTIRGVLANEHLHWNEFEVKPLYRTWYKCQEYPCRTYCGHATLYKYETHFPTLRKIFTTMGWSLEPLSET